MERQYEDLKDQLGLDHLEGRTHIGWHHHNPAQDFTVAALGQTGAAARDRLANGLRDTNPYLWIGTVPDNDVLTFEAWDGVKSGSLRSRVAEAPPRGEADR